MKSVNIVGLKTILCLLFFTISIGYSFSQLNNSVISDKFRPDSIDAGNWGLATHSFNYLRNTEYFNQIESGQTLFGSQLIPSLWLQANKSTRLRCGISINHSFGSHKIDNISPIISLSHTSNSGTFIFGTINGALSHQIIEPLFNVNNAIENRIEQGAQFFIDNDNFFLDTWINWQNYLPWKGDEHERFTAGFNILPKIKIDDNDLYLSFPVQLLFYHKGGQLNSDTTKQFSSVNGGAGLQVSWEFFPGNFINWDYYSLLSNNEIGNDKIGLGQYSNLSYDSQSFTLMFSWFRGNKFQSLDGTYIYQSQSRNDPALFLPQRELLFLRLMYNRALDEELHLSARLEPFYDFQSEKAEFSFSLYIVYRFGTAAGILGRED